MQAIEIENLSVSYGEANILEELSLAIPEGKITIIIGSNGSGKSTLLKTVGRVLKPRNGIIKIQGRDIRQQHAKEIARHVAMLPQSPKTPQGLLVKELVAYGRFPHTKAIGGFNRHDKEMVSWAMEETSLSEFAERTVDSLSGGQRQRAWIAMALAQETEILLLDEPTTYLDMSYQLEVLLLLQRLNKEQGRTIVMVLHELNHACRFADEIIGVHQGKVVMQGAPKQVITKESLQQIYGIQATLTMSEDGTYPICHEYNF